MSTRNSQQAKGAARERLRAERERQAKKDRTKRQALVAGSVVVVLAIAGAVSYLVVQNSKPSGWEAAQDKAVVAPKNTSGKNGTTVVIGKADAPKTMKMYEDPRCPICSEFEETNGQTIDDDVDAGKYKIQYVGATFIDGDSGGKLGTNGEGSKNALSAMGAALNVSPEAFLDYKSALYSKKWHPDETDDKFKDDSYLLKVADTVPALKKSAAFKKDVTGGTYDSWALAMSKAFDKNKDDVTGTPSLVMDGKKIVGSDGQNAPMTLAEYKTALAKALKA